MYFDKDPKHRLEYIFNVDRLLKFSRCDRLERSERRIAFVEARYQSFYGAQRSLYTLVTNLSTQFEPVVLLPGDGVVANKYRDAGVDVHIIPLGGNANLFGGEVFRLSLWKRLGVVVDLLKYNLRVARWLEDYDIDVVYANDFRALIYAGIAAKLVKKPVLWYVRADGLSPLEACMGVRLATRIILIANGVKRAFPPRDLRRYARKFCVLYTGFELDNNFGCTESEVCAKLDVPARVPVIGIVGSICHRKGHDLLVHALAHLKSRKIDAHLLVVGGSPVGHEHYRRHLEDLIDSHDLSSQVHWLGYQENVMPLYRLMDVLVLPSRSEGLPRTLIEGLFAGVPVVATDVGGVSEIVAMDYLGQVVPPDDVTSLAEALAQVLTDNRMRSEEVRELRTQYVRERFGLNHYVRGFEAIVKTLN